jgi:sulfoxide reductase heme-binding subunit YedZ
MKIPSPSKEILMWITHIGCLIPLGLMGYRLTSGAFIPDPIKEFTLWTGKTALILLMLTLTVTPLNTLFKWRQTIPLRRWLGLYTFFYASIHMSIFLFIDYGLDLNILTDAFLEKKYALAGLTAFLIMIPQAITSTKGWQRRLGKKWTTLHWWVYIAAIAVVVHFIWLTKQGVLEPWFYGLLLAILFIMRQKNIRKWLSNQKWLPNIG